MTGTVEPVSVPPGIYAGCLGPAIVTALAANPGARDTGLLLDVISFPVGA
jgi:hypothetical protein